MDKLILKRAHPNIQSYWELYHIEIIVAGAHSHRYGLFPHIYGTYNPCQNVQCASAPSIIRMGYVFHMYRWAIHK